MDAEREGVIFLTVELGVVLHSLQCVGVRAFCTTLKNILLGANLIWCVYTIGIWFSGRSDACCCSFLQSGTEVCSETQAT